jgi:rod shape-determining protein MreC
MLALDKMGILGSVRNSLSWATTPIQLGWYRFEQGIADRLGVIGHVGTLAQDNLKLRSDNDKLKVEIIRLSQVDKENKDLRAQLSTPQTDGYTMIETQTLGYVPDVGTKELLLSSGSSVGVREGQVVVSGNVILGRIINVTADKSTLRLLTDPQTKMLVATLRGGTRGILVGQFQSSLEMTKVLPDGDLRVGDSVVATGEENWPKGMAVGEITKISRTEGELFQQADIKPLISYDSLQTVFILRGVK